MRRGALRLASLAALYDDPRFEIYSASELTPEWTALAAHLPALVAATSADPFDTLGYVITASIRIPVVLLVEPAYLHQAPALLHAGAACCLALPLTRESTGVLLRDVQRYRRTALVDGRTRVLLDPVTRRVRRADRSAHLTEREYALLHHLCSADGQPVATEQLLAAVWSGLTARPGKAVLEVHVCQLRKKLRAIGLDAALRTVRGFGYSFQQPR